MIKCFNKLKLAITAGPENSDSNHFVYAPTQFYVMFSIMLRSMLIHGSTPNDLLASVIISIPKDNNGKTAIIIGRFHFVVLYAKLLTYFCLRHVVTNLPPQITSMLLKESPLLLCVHLF